MKFALVAAIAVASVEGKHHFLHNLKNKIGEFHKKHPHPIKEFIEHHKKFMDPTKQDLLKEYYEVKKEMAVNTLKLEADKKFVEMDEKLIEVTQQKLDTLIKNGATKEQIDSVQNALDVEKQKEADAVADEAKEQELLEKESAEADELWEKIKNLPGSQETGATPTKQELLEKLAEVKREYYANEVKVKADDEFIKFD